MIFQALIYIPITVHELQCACDFSYHTVQNILDDAICVPKIFQGPLSLNNHAPIFWDRDNIVPEWSAGRHMPQCCSMYHTSRKGLTCHVDTSMIAMQSSKLQLQLQFALYLACTNFIIAYH